MDFQYTPDQQAFRLEVRGWLEENLPADLCVDDAFDERVAPDRATFDRRVAWQRKMYESRWVGISWPATYGGRDATLMEQIIFDEEYFRRARGGAVAWAGSVGYGSKSEVIPCGTPSSRGSGQSSLPWPPHWSPGRPVQWPGSGE